MCILWRSILFSELMATLRTPKLTCGGYFVLKLKKQCDLRVHIDWQHLVLLDWSRYKSQINHFHCYNLLPNGNNQPAKPFIS